ncbi:endonuclease/exonuclease/phosphatase family protein [Arhodomonas sp. AD133]|uniref:endonuclease/exonuclease/phosphatase family protein n=1 Tax=Arhodomonas sp. AD133 TaxID=3415009 RepID=UPI003EB90304
MRLRLATFNAALTRPGRGALARDLAAGDSRATAVAAIIRRVRPDILLINELDFDPRRRALRRFVHHYLGGAGDDLPLAFDHCFTAPVNTGLPSGFDLDGDGATDGPGDALGFGRFPGQYGMAVLSRFPVETSACRTFRRFLWRDMPDARLPMNPATGAPWYTDEALAVLPLSSKSHWDVAIRVAGTRLRLLASHPTPPAFDGTEGRNWARNHDEVRFWCDYLDGAAYPVDDDGHRGGRPDDSPVAIAGDLNADPGDGNGHPEAIERLLTHSALQDAAPRSNGAATTDGRPGWGDRSLHTAAFGPFGLRVDYVLPDARLPVLDAGVFWPAPGEPGHELVGNGPEVISSDHRLVWVDVEWPAQSE